MDSNLLKLDMATQLLAEVRSVDDATELIDLAEAARVYAKQVKLGLEAQNHAAEIKLRAQRRAGEILDSMEKNKGAQGLGINQYTKVQLHDKTAPPTYADLEIDKRDAHVWQTLAAIPEPVFEKLIADKKDAVEEITTASIYREAKQAERRNSPPLPAVDAVFSAILGDNSEIIPQILQLYLPDGGQIADPTWGEGVFWSRVDREKYKVVGTDIEKKPGIEQADFRDLPYDDKEFDAVVFDPPYKLTGTPVEIDRYRNQSGGWRDVQGFYEQGIAECYRILIDDGILVVKCMDQVVSGKQMWFHRIVFDIATRLGAIPEDLIVMVRPSPTPQPYQRQVHAWKNHSYFWVFRKGVKNGKLSTTSR